MKQFGLVAAFAALISAGAGEAQQTSGNFAAQALGFKVGDLALNGSVAGGKYTVSAQFVTSGLVATVAGLRFVMKSTGSVRDGRFTPRSYSEDMDTGKRQSRVALRWSGGVAKATGSEIGDRGPYAVTASQQRGAVDPLTAMFQVVRAQPDATLCKLRQRIYDGERLTEIVLDKRSESGGNITCRGVFRRVAGYSPEDLRERSQFPLTVIYGPSGDLMQATRVEAQTIYGKARLVRR